MLLDRDWGHGLVVSTAASTIWERGAGVCSRALAPDPRSAALGSPTPTNRRPATLPPSTWKRILHPEFTLKSSHEHRYPVDFNLKSNLFILIHQRCFSSTSTRSLRISSEAVEEFNQRVSRWITELDSWYFDFSFWFVLLLFLVLQFMSSFCRDCCQWSF